MLAIFIFILIYFSSCEGFKVDKNPSIEAITELVNSFYVKDGENFDVIEYGNSSKYFDDVINGFVSKPYNLIKIKNTQLWNHELDQSALILIESLNDVRKLYEDLELINKAPKKLRFLLYIKDKNGTQVFDRIPPSILRYSEKVGNFTLFTFFLTESEKSLQLSTLEFYNEKFCSKPQVLLLNEFNKTSKKWKSKLDLPEKFKNFHGCLISFYLLPDYDGIYDVKTKKFWGFTPDMVYAMAQVGNFTPYFQLPGRVKRPYKHIILPNAVAQSKSTRLMSTIPLHVTSSFEDSELYLVLSPAEKYSNWEKVLVPFDETTWIYISITFGVAFISIFVIRHLPKIIQNTIFGFDVRVPAFNVAGTFFGIGKKSSEL